MTKNNRATFVGYNSLFSFGGGFWLLWCLLICFSLFVVCAGWLWVLWAFVTVLFADWELLRTRRLFLFVYSFMLLWLLWDWPLDLQDFPLVWLRGGFLLLLLLLLLGWGAWLLRWALIILLFLNVLLWLYIILIWLRFILLGFICLFFCILIFLVMCFSLLLFLLLFHFF